MTVIMTAYFILSAVCAAGALLAIPLAGLFFPRDHK